MAWLLRQSDADRQPREQNGQQLLVIDRDVLRAPILGHLAAQILRHRLCVGQLLRYHSTVEQRLKATHVLVTLSFRGKAGRPAGAAAPPA